MAESWAFGYHQQFPELWSGVPASLGGMHRFDMGSAG